MPSSSDQPAGPLQAQLSSRCTAGLRPMMGDIEPDTIVTLHVIVRPYAQQKGAGEPELQCWQSACAAV